MPSEVVQSPKLSAIIVNYNTREMTLECLRTLIENLEQDQIPAEIIVVDNASSDGSVEAIRNAFPQITVIASPTNRGFGAANNLAMKQATGNYFLLLNTDAFPKPHAFSALVDYLEKHPRVGVVGPRLLNRDGSLQTSCYKFPSPGRAWLDNLWIASLFPDHAVLGDYRKWPHDELRSVEWIIGACMLIRREVVQQVGGFDEKFFMYAEESDWQKRIHAAGWEISFNPAAEVTHFGGASGASEKAKINRHFFNSLDYYEWKHHGTVGLILLRAAMAVGCFLRFWLWLLAALLPSRRAVAVTKLQLHAWLFRRQVGCWSLSAIHKGDA